MKKVVFTLAAIAMVACFSFTSCNKKCTCKASAMGVTVESEMDIDDFNSTYGTDFKKCSEANIAGIIKCE